MPAVGSERVSGCLPTVLGFPLTAWKTNSRPRSRDGSCFLLKPVPSRTQDLAATLGLPVGGAMTTPAALPCTVGLACLATGECAQEPVRGRRGAEAACYLLPSHPVPAQLLITRTSATPPGAGASLSFICSQKREARGRSAYLPEHGARALPREAAAGRPGGNAAGLCGVCIGGRCRAGRGEGLLAPSRRGEPAAGEVSSNLCPSFSAETY